MESPNDVISLKAYCTAFYVVNREWGDQICGRLQEDARLSDISMSAFDVGDGYLFFYTRSTARSKEIGFWSMLSENGIFSKRYGTPAVEEVRVDRSAAAYFIAGAFGASELSCPGDIDVGLAISINELYIECSANESSCEDGAAAAKVEKLFAEATEKKDLRDAKVTAYLTLKIEIENLIWRLSIVERGITAKTEYAARTKHLRKVAFARASGIDELKRKRDVLREMLTTAKKF